jgi:hypothetical protein
MHINDLFDPLYIEDLVDKGPLFMLKQSGTKVVDNTKVQQVPIMPKLARQDSVDDFLAGQRVLPEAIHQFMAENVFDNQRPCPNLSEGVGPTNQAHTHDHQSNQPPPAIPKLKRADSVDDFLPDDRARSRSLTDFISIHEEDKSSTKRLKSADPPVTIHLEQTPEPTSHRPAEPSSQPSNGQQVGTTPKGNVRRRRRETTPNVSSSSEEGREGRRREQNREAQRRFRERRKYLEFQAFSQRLAATAAAAAAAQPSSYYSMTMQPTFFPAQPPRPQGNFPGFFGIM